MIFTSQESSCFKNFSISDDSYSLNQWPTSQNARHCSRKLKKKEEKDIKFEEKKKGGKGRKNTGGRKRDSKDAGLGGVAIMRSLISVAPRRDCLYGNEEKGAVVSFAIMYQPPGRRARPIRNKTPELLFSRCAFRGGCKNRGLFAENVTKISWRCCRWLLKNLSKKRAGKF